MTPETRLITLQDYSRPTPLSDGVSVGGRRSDVQTFAVCSCDEGGQNRRADVTGHMERVYQVSSIMYLTNVLGRGLEERLVERLER